MTPQGRVTVVAWTPPGCGYSIANTVSPEPRPTPEPIVPKHPILIVSVMRASTVTACRVKRSARNQAWPSE